jgi:hypothetical protein
LVCRSITAARQSQPQAGDSGDVGIRRMADVMGEDQ